MGPINAAGFLMYPPPPPLSPIRFIMLCSNQTSRLEREHTTRSDTLSASVVTIHEKNLTPPVLITIRLQPMTHFESGSMGLKIGPESGVDR